MFFPRDLVHRKAVGGSQSTAIRTESTVALESASRMPRGQHNLPANLVFFNKMKMSQMKSIRSQTKTSLSKYENSQSSKSGERQ